MKPYHLGPDKPVNSEIEDSVEAVLESKFGVDAATATISRENHSPEGWSLNVTYEGEITEPDMMFIHQINGGFTSVWVPSPSITKTTCKAMFRVEEKEIFEEDGMDMIEHKLEGGVADMANRLAKMGREERF